MAVSGDAVDGAELPPIDVLIVVALEDELDAVLTEGGGAEGWQTVRDHVHVRRFPNDTGQTLGVAAAWTGAMGSTATAVRAAPLVKDLQPSCLAMCGICAGKRGDVALGDVIVADRTYCFDHGKLVAASDGKEAPSFFHDITTYNLERSWHMNAAAFRRDLGWAKALLALRPPTKQAQRRWLLRTLLAHERDGGLSPLDHPERAAIFRTGVPGSRDWAELIIELRKQGLLESGLAALKLSPDGRIAAEDDHLLHPDGAPPDPEFRVHVGPIATGSAVIEDPQIFDRLKRVGRKTLGVEMEAFAIGYVGDELPQRAIVAKAVSDHADHDKDDRFRAFACRASAAWLFAFLKKHLAPRTDETRIPTTVRASDPGPSSPFPDLGASRPEDLQREVNEQTVSAGELRSGNERHGVGELHRRVERALALRHPEIPAAWKHGPGGASATLQTFLEMREPRGRHTILHVVAIVEGDLEESPFEAFLEHVVKRYEASTQHVEPRMVHTGAVSTGVRERAHREGVRLVSLLELQGLLDFRPYVEHQMSTLERDPIYPRELFVPQRLEYRVGRDPFEADDALATLDSWLGQDGPQLMLLLGDFGTGKTFLMHELALRLGRRHLESSRAIVPILVELRRLEKARSLDALLAQHFIPERGMRRFDHDAFNYMLDEGRVVLLFDGFDELALRVTYSAAAEHLETVLQAAIGKAKVVITSRTQHFLNDSQVRQALGVRVQQRGFRMMRLLPFDKGRIKQFLINRFDDSSVAQRRFELLDEVKDLLGLSHNPRILGFIAEIDENHLREAAKEEKGEITSATLYRVLLGRWLGQEFVRDHPPGMELGASEKALWTAATELAKLLWRRKERTIVVDEIPPEILDEVGRLSERPLSREAAAFKIGSATLLCRDEDGRFSFIHQSVLEWLVASAAAEDLRARRPPALLASAEISDLMVDFLWGLAGKDPVLAWAKSVLAAPPSVQAAANASRALQRLGQNVNDLVADLAGQDLRGHDFSVSTHLSGAMLERANLSDSSLVRANLSNARLAHADLRRANLTKADLTDADLQGANLSFARLLGANLAGAKLAGARLRYAALVGAQIEPDGLHQVDMRHVVPPRPVHVEVTVGAPLAPCASVAFSPDGAFVAAGYANGTVTIWDGASGGAVRVIEGHSGRVNSVAFSPDGSILASAATDTVVRLWDPSTGKLLRALDHSGAVTSVAFSPKRGIVASASSDKMVRLWRRETGALLRRIEGHGAAVTTVAFSADGAELASGSEDGTVRLWLSDTGRALGTFGDYAAAVTSVAFSPDGQMIALSSNDRTVRLLDAHSGRLVHMLEGHSDRVVSVAFSPDGILASASVDKTVRLWSQAGGTPLRALVGHSDWVTAVAFSPDGSLLASASEDKDVRLWRPHTGKSVSALEGKSDWIMSATFSPDGQLLASASNDKTVRLWRAHTGKPIADLAAHTDRVRSVAFSPDGRLLASASDDNTVRVWHLGSGKPPRTLEGHFDGVTSVAFSRDGDFLASASFDNTVRLWHPESGRMLGVLGGHSDRVRSIAISPDSRLLASGSDDKTVRVWRLHSGKSLDTIAAHSERVMSVTFSPDGRLIASASEDKTICLWRAANRKPLRVLEKHSDRVMTVAFSPDSRILASGSSDHLVRLWSTDTGAPLGSLAGHSHWIMSVAFSPDGRILASASLDKVVRLWRVEPALRGDPSACLAVIVPGRGGWAAYTPDGRYKLGGDARGLLGFTVGLCRFEPGELDAYPDAFDHPPRRIADDDLLFVLGR